MLHPVYFQYILPSFVATISATIFCIVCGLLNFATIFCYQRSNRKYKRQNLSESEKVSHKIESRLTVYAIITFISQMMMVLYMVYKTDNTVLKMNLQVQNSF